MLETISQVAEALGLSVTSEFVPLSQSRNRAEKCPSLNFRVTVARDGREVITTDYSMGSGHTCAYKMYRRPDTLAADADIRNECEMGTTVRPPCVEVLWSLAQDAAAIDCPTFEEWAPEFGYDPDSRKAEAIYKDCLAIALKLRAGLGNADFQRLREAVED